MFKIQKRRSLAAAVAMVLTFSTLLTGCASNQPVTPTKAMKITYNAGAEPKTLDPGLFTGVPESHIGTALFEGLTRIGEGQKVMPGIAESWTVSPDGTVYTFKLRDAKWNNGDPLTAEDFKYSWLRALSPELASEYSYQLYYIKGGEAYNSKKGTADAVGIKVIDPKTLEVTLEAATPYFLALTAFQTYYPVNKKNVEANKDWSLNPATFISDGPFKMKEWKHNDEVVAVKSDTYWDAKNVKLSEVDFKLIDDGKAALTAYEAGDLDGTDNIPIPDIQRLRDSKVLKTAPYIGTYFYRFNVTKKPFDNVKVRQALSMAIDRKMLIDQVTKGGQIPAYAYTPPGMVDVAPGSDFRQTGGDFIKEDIPAAKALLAEAGYPDGKNWPADVTILYNTSASHKLIAEAIQNMWKTNLGIDVKLRNEEWAVYLDSQSKLNFDISRAGWIGDYADAMTFMDMFVTKGGNNETGWSNADYDNQIAIAKKTGDESVRIPAMHAAEKILMDQMPIMPIYYYVNNFVLKDNIKGAFRSSLGPIDFKLATVE